MAADLGVLMVGLGKIGRMHAANVAYHIPHVRLAAVCDTDGATLERAQADFAVPGARAIDEALAIPGVDAVAVASPAQSHAEAIDAAVRAGKHVFSEKPIGLTLQDTDPVLQAVLDAGITFQIGFQRRWDPDYLEAKRQIASAAIGRPLLFRAHGRDPQFTGPMQDPATGGGIFLDAAMHDYDAARFLLGREAVAVSAQGATLLHQHLTALGDVDTCTTQLTLEGGALALLEWNRITAYGYDVYAEVLGSEGAIHIGGLQNRRVMTLSRRGVSHDVTPWFAERFREAYLAEIEAFARAALDGGPASPGIEDARTALHIAIEAREASLSGSARPIAPLAPLRARTSHHDPASGRAR